MKKKIKNLKRKKINLLALKKQKNVTQSLRDQKEEKKLRQLKKH